jgi:phosphoglycolate phosphatase
LLIILDLDGTLYRTDYVLKQAVKLAADELGIQVPSENDILRAIGGTSSGFGDKIGAGLNPVTREKFLERIRFHDRRMIPDIGKTYDGIDDLLCFLVARGFELAICSNGSAPYVELVLESCRIIKYFRYIKSRQDHISKSEQVRRLLEESRSTRSIMVGDRKFDFQAARENNIPFIGAAYGYGEDEIAQADFIAESPAAIKGNIMRYILFDHIAQKLDGIQSNRAIIAGVDGIDTSGKTVFADSLAGFIRKRRRHVQLIHLDDFLNVSSLRKKGGDPVRAYFDNAFDLNLLVNKLLVPARQGKTVLTTLKLLNLETDTIDREMHFQIDATTTVIIEGVLLYREPLDRHFDYRIFLDISFDEMLRRATVRDKRRFGKGLLERYKRKYIPVQEFYFKECNPRGKSDMVIDNTDYEMPVVLNSK